MNKIQRVQVIDSHTGGEPTRLVLNGGPDLGAGPLFERLARFRSHHDAFRSAVVNEPRGSDVLVGALLCEPHDPRCITGVIFFNNVGYLGMCGHGTIGLVSTLLHMGKIAAGEHWIDTPVGSVKAILHASGEVTIANVRSYRAARQVAVDVPGYGRVTGDIAWGGNWFYLVDDHKQEIALSRVEPLIEFTWAIRNALVAQGIRGNDGGEIDHIELFSASGNARADSKNFVLCPGKAYDRSPCGTGTSAKLACLYEDGKLKPGEIWRQQSILDSAFEGTVEIRNGEIYPSITGRAFVTAEGTLILNPADPFMSGIRA
jgi:4-hydroxyproline epimerase